MSGCRSACPVRAARVAVGARGDGIGSVQVRGVGTVWIGVKMSVHGPGPAGWWRWKRGGVPRRRVVPLVRRAACVKVCGCRVWLGEQLLPERPAVQALPSCVTVCCTVGPGCVRSSSPPTPTSELAFFGLGDKPPRLTTPPQRRAFSE